MMPGGRGMNPRQMQMMMKRLGMSTEPIDGVDEVIVRTATEEHIFKKPEVTILTVQGVRTYQVVGQPTIRPRTAGTSSEPAAPTALAPPAPPPGPPEEDITLVMEQGQCDRPTAIRALQESDGEPAEAILRLLSRRGDGGR